MKKHWIILAGIILLAAVLRLYALGQVPVSPDWDEASLGYNAYSLLITGKDEYGEFLPITLRSFNDYKPGLYAYLIIPFIVLFDVSLLAIRLPSALLGILTVVAVFYLIRHLFKNTSLALLTALLLAISPWHIQFSRAGFEANVGLAFVVFTALFFLKSFKKPWLLSVSAFFASLSLSMYQSEKLFMPLFVLLLLVLYRKQLLLIPKRYIGSAIVIGFIVAIPFFQGLVSGQALSRAQGTSVFAKETADTKRYQQRFADSVANDDPFGELMNNRRIVYTKQALGGYLSHYNLNWLFITGDNPRHHAPNMGLLYLWELPFLLLGIYALIFYRKPNDDLLREKLFIFGWFLLAPLPAAFTIDTPHAIRTLNFLPTFQLFIALGVMHAYHLLKIHAHDKSMIRRLGRVGVLGIFLLFVGFNLLYYLNQYFVQYNYAYSQDWQYGYKEVIAFLQSDTNRDKNVIVSDVMPLDQSYIFFLFYTKYPPAEYQKEVHAYATQGGARSFGRYTFKGIQWGQEKPDEETLYVDAVSNAFPDTLERKHEVLFLNGSSGIQVVGAK